MSWGKLNDGHTIGMEKEFIIVDPNGDPVDCTSIENACSDDRINHDYPSALGFSVWGIEINSHPYDNLTDLNTEMKDMVTKVRDEATGRGYKLMTAARHPDKGGYMAMHTHVGAADDREALFVTKALRAHLPEIIALASNSPKKGTLGKWCKDARMYSTNMGGTQYGRIIPNDPVVYGDEGRAHSEVLSFKRERWDGRGVVIAGEKDSDRLKGTIEVRCPDAQLTAEEDVAVAAFIWGIAEFAKKEMASKNYDWTTLADKEHERDDLQNQLDQVYHAGIFSAMGRGIRKFFGKETAGDQQYTQLSSQLDAADTWLAENRPSYDISMDNDVLKKNIDEVGYDGMDGTITYSKDGQDVDMAAKDAIKETYEKIKPVLDDLKIPDDVRERLEARVYGGRSGADVQIDAVNDGEDLASYVIEKSTNMEYLV